MSKILLVEDDNNLREIYEARLQAEGYDIVAARDGEEALTVAMKERPDLIISDVMMPKISGFDMLDIIRSTAETKDVKVIMMTALSQAEDKARADKLGADRYLVKSQVTLEDVAKVAREVLNGESSPPPKEETPTAEGPAIAAPAADPATPDPVVVPAPEPDDPATPVVPAAAVTVAPETAGTTVPANKPTDSTDATPEKTPDAPPMSGDKSATNQTLEEEQAAVAAQIESFIEAKKPQKKSAEEPAPVDADNTQTKTPTTPTVVSEEEVIAPAAEEKTSTGKKIIQPISDPNSSKGPDLEKLLEKEEEKNRMAAIAEDLAARSSHTVEKPAQTFVANTSTNPASNTGDPTTTPKVTVAEDSNLSVVSEPQAQTAPAGGEDVMKFEETASTPAAATGQQMQPNIPHKNGTSIDGVSATPQQQPAPEQPTAPIPAPGDPNAIAL